jgi:hypothetical protein
MERATHARSCRPHIERPDEPIGIAPLRLALDHEGLTADYELIVWPRVGDLARAQLERRGLGMNAVSPKPTIVSGHP